MIFNQKCSWRTKRILRIHIFQCIPNAWAATTTERGKILFFASAFASFSGSFFAIQRVVGRELRVGKQYFTLHPSSELAYFSVHVNYNEWGWSFVAGFAGIVIKIAATMTSRPRVVRRLRDSRSLLCLAIGVHLLTAQGDVETFFLLHNFWQRVIWIMNETLRDHCRTH